MNCTQLAATVIASLMGAGCSSAERTISNVETTFKGKPDLLRFATKHPIAAASIGRDDGSTNITSSAIRLSTRIGLDNSKNGDGRGTEVNAMRHSLWQATIAARFGESIATQAGNAYEKNIQNRDGTEYADRYSADEAVDLRNNAIGRRIGLANQRSTMNELAQKLLAEYYQRGLWTATSVKENNQTVWKISQNQLSESKYQTAINKLKELDAYGMTAAERAKLRQ